jgi:hypothetical protein
MILGSSPPKKAAEIHTYLSVTRERALPKPLTEVTGIRGRDRGNVQNDAAFVQDGGGRARAHST